VEAGINQGRTTFSEADFTHPVFDPVRPWLERLPRSQWPTHEQLNELASNANLRTHSGQPVRFVAPGHADPYYEVHLSATGQVHTRLENWHDLFNALAWLAFPRTKARINAMHAAQIPRESGNRGGLRDMLTLFDEGGAIVTCADPGLRELIREHRWKELFWEQRARTSASLSIHVLGHATLEMALKPWPGITCKVIFVDEVASPDERAEQWLIEKTGAGGTKDLASLPIFGYPGWLPDATHAAFYDDQRYFRPFRKKAAAPTENVVRP
jgi:hypothetical protein